MRCRRNTKKHDVQSSEPLTINESCGIHQKHISMPALMTEAQKRAIMMSHMSESDKSARVHSFILEDHTLPPDLKEACLNDFYCYGGLTDINRERLILFKESNK